jgi:hypothetical protein
MSDKVRVKERWIDIRECVCDRVSVTGVTGVCDGGERECSVSNLIQKDKDKDLVETESGAET